MGIRVFLIIPVVGIKPLVLINYPTVTQTHPVIHSCPFPGGYITQTRPVIHPYPLHPAQHLPSPVGTSHRPVQWYTPTPFTPPSTSSPVGTSHRPVQWYTPIPFTLVGTSPPRWVPHTDLSSDTPPPPSPHPVPTFPSGYLRQQVGHGSLTRQRVVDVVVVRGAAEARRCCGADREVPITLKGTLVLPISGRRQVLDSQGQLEREEIYL